MASKILISFVVVAVLAVYIQAASITKREAASRPETPLLNECEEPGENRENCFIQDPANLEIWTDYLEEVTAWEKANPKAAEDFNKMNPNKKNEDQATLAEVKKFSALHEH